MPIPTGSVVLTTMLEHHSNDLPWRDRAEVVHVGATAGRRARRRRPRAQLDRHRGRVPSLAVSGASNVTGVVQPVHALAELVHAGRRPDRRRRRPAGPAPADRHARPTTIPAPRRRRVQRPQDVRPVRHRGARRPTGRASGPGRTSPGGGTVQAVTLDDVVWADLPDREESGSPNVVGAVALAAAIEALTAIGMTRLAAHETDLTGYAIARLAAVPGLTLHGPAGVDRVGVDRPSVAGRPHALVAAVLGRRARRRRAQRVLLRPPVRRPPARARPDGDGRWARRVAAATGARRPGLVRLSLGCYNDRADVDRAVAGLRHVADGTFRGRLRRAARRIVHPSGLSGRPGPPVSPVRGWCQHPLDDACWPGGI